MMRESLERTLGGDVGSAGWTQATCGVKDAGLGFRTAYKVALPAFIASRVAAWPGAESIFQDLQTAGLADAAVLVQSQATCSTAFVAELQ
jgi:hypothetical protein